MQAKTIDKNSQCETSFATIELQWFLSTPNKCARFNLVPRKREKETWVCVIVIRNGMRASDWQLKWAECSFFWYDLSSQQFCKCKLHHERIWCVHKCCIAHARRVWCIATETIIMEASKIDNDSRLPSFETLVRLVFCRILHSCKYF